MASHRIGLMSRALRAVTELAAWAALAAFVVAAIAWFFDYEGA